MSPPSRHSKTTNVSGSFSADQMGMQQTKQGLFPSQDPEDSPFQDITFSNSQNSVTPEIQ